MYTEQDGYSGVPGWCTHPQCTIGTDIILVFVSNMKSSIHLAQARPFERVNLRVLRTRCQHDGASARPADELSLVRGGGGEQRMKWGVEGGYSQGHFESLPRGGWER